MKYRYTKFTGDDLDASDRIGGLIGVVHPVDHAHSGAGGGERGDHGTADESAATGDQNVFFRKLMHLTNLRYRPVVKTSRSAFRRLNGGYQEPVRTVSDRVAAGVAAGPLPGGPAAGPRPRVRARASAPACSPSRPQSTSLDDCGRCSDSNVHRSGSSGPTADRRARWPFAPPVRRGLCVQPLPVGVKRVVATEEAADQLGGRRAAAGGEHQVAVGRAGFGSRESLSAEARE